MKRSAEPDSEDDRRRDMGSSTRPSMIRSPSSTLYDPQPSDVPVTVVTALILLLVLCVVALL